MRRHPYQLPDAMISLFVVACMAFAFFAGRFFRAGEIKAKEQASIMLAMSATGNVDTDQVPLGSYRATVTRVIDGDTVEARVRLWIGQEILTKIRLRGIDAPEIMGACGSEKLQAEAARKRLQALIDQQMVWLTEIGPDKYNGRVVAKLLTKRANDSVPAALGTESTLVDAGAVLVSEKLARPYDGKRRESWCVLAGG